MPSAAAVAAPAAAIEPAEAASPPPSPNPRRHRRSRIRRPRPRRRRRGIRAPTPLSPIIGTPKRESSPRPSGLPPTRMGCDNSAATVAMHEASRSAVSGADGRYQAGATPDRSAASAKRRTTDGSSNSTAQGSTSWSAARPGTSVAVIASRRSFAR